ncbi:MAG: HesA/MoeB/ThiF family protein [Eggerthellaceae bacterium]|nr:HesA/MoeB/ThiF family protein [Eggerthellaceae bacterium]
MAISDRYDRNMTALSPEECAALATKRIAVVGCGGLGGLAIEALARIGVGHLRVIDGDVFEESNLNRQLLCTEADLGREKALVAAARVNAVNSEVEVDPVVTYLGEDNASELLSGFDCVVDCLDNLEARFWMAHACQNLGIPVVYGAIAGWFGQVCTVHPGDVSFAALYGEPFGESQHKKLGNLPFTAYSISSIQAAEAVKVVLGKPGQIRNRLLMVDLLDGSVDDMELR